ncbi:GH36-type glycosyl hydrolase domain-containing protein [Haloimpatiens sp. FM7330]|uniref:GH36-type glycosyl hydrolase domain-containing protein n=1 Tax=Haloimpatiens sp. FM7330 TaxID=3298610 RepID=UPI003638DDF0
MTYTITIISVSVIFMILYIFKSLKKENNDETPMDIVPKIIVNIDDLEKHAEEMAAVYSKTEKGKKNKRLIKSIEKSFNYILIAHKKVDEYQKNNNDRLHAGEWLLDNMFLIEKEYKQVKSILCKKDYRNLPVLTRGIMKGYPRVYHIAVEMISHTDGNIDEKTVERFIKAYQKNSILTSKELWALPVMIKTALIQNISTVANSLVFAQEEKRKADFVGERIINACNGGDICKELTSFFEEDVEFTYFFAERLLKLLKDNGIENTKVYEWIDEKLQIKETDYDKVIIVEHQKEAALQLSMGNCISSIRKIEAMNFRKYFEELSYVENLLKKDPACIYEKMDFESKDYYRHKIEKLSKKFKLPESFVVKKALECAQNSKIQKGKEYVKHIGYYIIDDGIVCLKEKLNIKKGVFNKKENKVSKNRVRAYLSTIIIGTIIVMSIFIWLSFINDNDVTLWRYIIAVIALLIPCSEIVISIFHWSINYLTSPRFIPKMNLKDGIGKENRTIVVIPTIINNIERAKELVNQMEIYYLANKFDNLYFALLGDFKDSDKEHEENDDKIVNFTLREIEILNKKYCNGKENIFFYLSRYRKYNTKEEKWLAWERKRGKIMEFNLLLRGDNNTSYNVISSDISELKEAKYVITLDADTQLPRNAARKLIGAMAHVLNKPIISNKTDRVMRGYGLLQPRISVDVTSANKTLFSEIFSGEIGIDVYTTAISDVYQDLFGEGIFTGKGIYDIDIFNYKLKDEIPENSVLSHDLLEGSYVKAGLVTDIELIDGYPAYYNASCKRLHRWVRGDWQLIPWIFKKNGLNTLSKWKLLDNLRRSLLAPSVIILITLSFNVLPDGTDKWVAAAILAFLCPILFDITEFVISPIKGISLSGKISGIKMVFSQVFFIFCFIPYQAYLMIDAIFRTLYRLLISKKNMLEWQTAADAEKSAGKTLTSYIKSMWMGSAIALGILVLAFTKSYYAGVSALPFSLVWFLSPAVAYWISKDKKKVKNKLNNNEINEVREISRRTWAYFEDFICEENNWLAPDNYQEEPHKGVAYRTSPTNLGMGLMSNITAYDLGYIGLLELIDRLNNIISSMESMKKMKGHFYNWYDTRTKEPLYPRYISTVDSGNLVGYLWVISEALKEYLNNEIPIKNYILGLEDTARLADKEIKEKAGIENHYINILKEIDLKEIDIFTFNETLKKIQDKYKEVFIEDECDYWNKKLKCSVDMLIKETNTIFPWINNISKEQKLCKSIDEVFLNKSFSQITKLDGLKDVKVNDLLKVSKEKISSINLQINDLINRISLMAENTDFSLVFDNERELFTIGYDVENNTISKSYYDLLASEARQATFVAISKGDVSEVVWFKLGRALANINNSKGLVSWSGTMFEYFMPLLIMKNYPNTLLDQTYNSVIHGQKAYCSNKNVPWGISESAFYHFDVDLNYQYKAFGVPGIGVKRGLSDELVISPYSTVLAMQLDVKGAFQNLKVLIKEGILGKYGFYEAVDYTKERLKGKESSIVKCFMVHHQGMSLMALDNVLNNNILQNRFHNIPRVKASELLLQERIPKVVIYQRENDYSKEKEEKIKTQDIIVRNYKTAKTTIPQIHLVSNGEYSLMISNSGSGYSKYKDMTIYRWREDVTLDNSGMFFYIKDASNNKYFSSTYEPCQTNEDRYEVTFSLDKAQFKRKDKDITTQTEIVVSNEDNAEIRKISIINNSDIDKIIEITSYCEVTLSNYSADLVHPAFQNLFVQTEYVEQPECILATRRARKKEDKDNQPWIMQTVLVNGEALGAVQYETSRVNFIGRGGNLKNPLSMEKDIPLKNSVGTVLDPIMSIRRRVKIPKGQKCEVIYTIAFSHSRDEVIELAKKYNEYSNVDRSFKLAWAQAQLDMKYLAIKSTQANLYQLAASKILFLNSSFKNREQYIKRITKSQSDLWKYGISGDVPIVLLICRTSKDIHLVKQLLKAHEYWSIKGLKVDLVIVNLEDNSYTQPLQNTIKELILSSSLRDKQNKSGGVFFYNRATIEEEDIEFLISIARLFIDSEKGSFVNQIKDSLELSESEEELKVQNINYDSKPYKHELEELKYFNGYGGFSKNGDKYVIVLKDDKNTPAPWINVISNKNFGFNVTERGSTYTWCLNSRENKITTWSNDWVTDWCDEILYLRDEINGKVWSITCNPIRDKGEYVIEHGFGYSTFTHECNGIIGKTTMFVPKEDNVKVCLVNLKNNTSQNRSLSLTYYSRLVLGVVPQQTSQYISTYYKEDKKYVYGSNPYSSSFGNLKAYLKIVGGKDESFSGDRTEFLGRCGNYENPEVLKKQRLTNNVGAGLDPCLAYNSKIDLNPDEEKTLIILFGEDESLEKIDNVIDKYSNEIDVAKELENVKSYWNNLLHTVEVDTPDETMDIMLNGWLMYQTLVCRIWARSAFYQSGGAYGFRDQLQDVMQVAYLDPTITKEHILYSASRQFIEGDVQHWWHPIVESGIRTRFSDDLLWLPYVTIHYIKSTGDYSILNEEVAYLEDEPLQEGEDERYKISSVSNVKGTIYEHCVKAIERSLKFGVHNIPLMGSGDWNDGMSTVGNKGKGESVWVGWFLYSILNDFTDLCVYMNDSEKKNKYDNDKEFIRRNLEENAWDGSWYRRAYFDDETPLGSSQNDECQIDSLSQSWAVISGAANEDRAKEAMKSLEKYLVKEDKGMVLLLTPPFDKSNLEPGYIKGYVAGVRENGGQYTHAATWVIWALCKLGMGDKAWKIYNMINPINHTRSYLECETFKTEPYVMTADVYAKEPHEGRGGWSWYTGTSGWMYRVAIDGILGLKLKGDKGFTIEPSIPNSWKEYKITYRKKNSIYKIKITKSDRKEVKLDGKVLDDRIVPYLQEGEHIVEVTI